MTEKDKKEEEGKEFPEEDLKEEDKKKKEKKGEESEGKGYPAGVVVSDDMSEGKSKRKLPKKRGRPKKKSPKLKREKKPIGITKKALELKKEIHKHMKRMSKLRHVRFQLEQNLEKARHNVKRWQKRNQAINKTLTSIDKTDNDLSYYSSRLRASKKSNLMQTEMEQKQSLKELDSYDSLSKKQAGFMKSIPAVKKLEMMTKLKQKVDKRIKKLDRKQENIGEAMKKLKEQMQVEGGEEGGETEEVEAP